ncbi:MAG: hypothetical protein CM15mP69_6080 [Ectothiorhodospiraceae bacterium]|nr:MAG: hypothetical protein CM15mP69_6080 [Ectothiorhodospiraceae bacterium]
MLHRGFALSPGLWFGKGWLGTIMFFNFGVFLALTTKVFGLINRKFPVSLKKLISKKVAFLHPELIRFEIPMFVYGLSHNGLGFKKF